MSDYMGYRRVAVTRNGQTPLFGTVLGPGIVSSCMLRLRDRDGRMWGFHLGWKLKETRDVIINKALLRLHPSRPLAVDVVMLQMDRHGRITPLRKTGRKRALMVLRR